MQNQTANTDTLLVAVYTVQVKSKEQQLLMMKGLIIV